MLSCTSSALLSIALLFLLVTSRCTARHHRDEDFSDDDEDVSSSHSRTRTLELRSAKARRNTNVRGRPRVGAGAPVKTPAAGKALAEYHFPYRPKFLAHPLLGLCRLEDFIFDKTRLGKGGFGEVFKATHKSGLVVAIKRTGAKSIKEKPKHVENEETIQRILMHPNIGQLLCTMRNDQHDIFFVLEYFKGENLAKQLPKWGELPRVLVAKYVAQIMSAFRYMHSLCIIYRDLKAENIMIDDEDNVKLIDFGLSVYSCERDQTSLAGTLEYIAPEVAKRANYGREADYYSLGVLLYLLKKKTLPYKRREMEKEEFTKQIAKGILTVPLTDDPWVDELIKLLTLPDQEERWKRVHEEFEKIQELKFFEGVDWSTIGEAQGCMF